MIAREREKRRGKERVYKLGHGQHKVIPSGIIFAALLQRPKDRGIIL
jgi:hypothetical protein